MWMPVALFTIFINEPKQKQCMNIWFVIAALNEEKHIPEVIKNLQKAGYRNIAVVDDGSKDDTAGAAEKAGASVLKHVLNRGQGAALQTGMDFALEQGADVIVHFDADGQHRMEDLPAMLRPVLEGEVDVTIGSRFLKDAKSVPLFRRILLKGSVFVIWLFYGVRMTDAHNGFRVLSREAAEKIRITCDRMEHASEIIDLIHRKKLSFREVPVIINYSKETLARGHGSYLGALRIFLKMLLRRFVQ